MLIHFENVVINLSASSTLTTKTQCDRYSDGAEIYAYLLCDGKEADLFFVRCSPSEQVTKLEAAKREAKRIIDAIVNAYSNNQKVFNIDKLIVCARNVVEGVAS